MTITREEVINATNKGVKALEELILSSSKEDIIAIKAIAAEFLVKKNDLKTLEELLASTPDLHDKKVLISLDDYKALKEAVKMAHPNILIYLSIYFSEPECNVFCNNIYNEMLKTKNHSEQYSFNSDQRYTSYLIRSPETLFKTAQRFQTVMSLWNCNFSNLLKQEFELMTLLQTSRPLEPFDRDRFLSAMMVYQGFKEQHTARSSWQNRVSVTEPSNLEFSTLI